MESTDTRSDRLLSRVKELQASAVTVEKLRSENDELAAKVRSLTDQLKRQHAVHEETLGAVAKKGSEMELLVKKLLQERSTLAAKLAQSERECERQKAQIAALVEEGASRAAATPLAAMVTEQRDAACGTLDALVGTADSSAQVSLEDLLLCRVAETQTMSQLEHVLSLPGYSTRNATRPQWKPNATLRANNLATNSLMLSMYALAGPLAPYVRMETPSGRVEPLVSVALCHRGWWRWSTRAIDRLNSNADERMLSALELTLRDCMDRSCMTTPSTVGMLRLCTGILPLGPVTWSELDTSALRDRLKARGCAICCRSTASGLDEGLIVDCSTLGVETLFLLARCTGSTVEQIWVGVEQLSALYDTTYWFSAPSGTDNRPLEEIRFPVMVRSDGRCSIGVRFTPASTSLEGTAAFVVDSDTDEVHEAFPVPMGTVKTFLCPSLVGGPAVMAVCCLIGFARSCKVEFVTMTAFYEDMSDDSLMQRCCVPCQLNGVDVHTHKVDIGASGDTVPLSPYRDVAVETNNCVPSVDFKENDLERSVLHTSALNEIESLRNDINGVEVSVIARYLERTLAAGDILRDHAAAVHRCLAEVVVESAQVLISSKLTAWLESAASACCEATLSQCALLADDTDDLCAKLRSDEMRWCRIQSRVSEWVIVAADTVQELLFAKSAVWSITTPTLFQSFACADRYNLELEEAALLEQRALQYTDSLINYMQDRSTLENDAAMHCAALFVSNVISLQQDKDEVIASLRSALIPRPMQDAAVLVNSNSRRVAYSSSHLARMSLELASYRSNYSRFGVVVRHFVNLQGADGR